MSQEACKYWLAPLEHVVFPFFILLPLQAEQKGSHSSYRKNLFSPELWRPALQARALWYSTLSTRRAPREDAQILALKTCQAVTPTQHREAGDAVKMETWWEQAQENMSKDLCFSYSEQHGSCSFSLSFMGRVAFEQTGPRRLNPVAKERTRWLSPKSLLGIDTMATFVLRASVPESCLESLHFLSVTSC